MDASDRFLVSITDPHLMADLKYKVFAQGVELEKQSTETNHINIFIRDSQGKEPWTGQCWPGLSVWTDFLNVNA
jgi:alpha-glucosidase (family GH31 glycosyl hydrolase)